ncbi:hypothetical protein L1765_12945 [Microaerobacter geothermalis]|uniref:hypothetical protein n=1 Tax=Microaerobacter geothermalis TaxID=674972 RepID=UPI001F382021|nr:hypothetical protein [Microaerobacter geothermalis]MCF6094867.1 hypothetical protein [Microaerobacter geothermalis]
MKRGFLSNILAFGTLISAIITIIGVLFSIEWLGMAGVVVLSFLMIVILTLITSNVLKQFLDKKKR